MSFRSAWLQYVLAILSAVVATGIQVALSNSLGYRYVFQAYFLAVMFSAWIGGFGPAVASLSLSAVLGAYFLLNPQDSLAIGNPRDQVGWISFLLIGFLIAVLGGKMRRSQGEAESGARRLRDQAERLQTTLGSIGDAVIVTDSRGNVHLMNAVAEKLTGWRQDEALGKPLLDVFRIINELTRHPLENPAERALREGVVAGLGNHTLLVAKDGSEWPIENSAAPICGEGGPNLGVVLVFREVTARRQADRRLLAQEERLRNALEAGRMGTWEWDLATNRVKWSAELEKIHNLPVGTFPGTFEAFQSDIHPEDRELVLARIQQTLQTGEDYLSEYRLLLPDQSICWVEARGRLIRDENAVPLRLTGVCMDVGQRKEAQQQIDLHTHMLESMLEGVVLCDAKGMIWYANQAAERMFGYGLGELHGRPVKSLNSYPPEENDRIVGEVIAQLREHQSWQGEFHNRRQDGSQFITSARINGLTYGGADHWLCVQEDITERKRREQDLEFLAEASRSFTSTLDYQQILEQIAQLAVPHFADWCVVHVPEPSGVPRQVVAAHVDPSKVAIVQDYARRFPPNPKADIGVAKVMRTGESELAEEITDSLLQGVIRDQEQLRILRELGMKSYISVPLKLPDRVIGVLTFISAETQRRFTPHDLAVAEDLARRAAKAVENGRLYARLREEHRRKDEFLAMLAHELRNPLAPIRSGLELLALSGVEHETIPLMREQVAHLVRLVDDLLDVSRFVQGKIRLQQKPVEMGQLVQHTVAAARSLVEEQSQHLEVSLPEHGVWVRGDKVRLTQCLTNLLQNAIKYTEPGGRIWVSLHQEGEYAELSVQDDGIGIESDLLPHIFELFTQADRSLERSKGGLGIGLTLVRSLVESQGGRITVRSEGLGQGSDFVIRMPLCEPEPEQDRPPPSPNGTLHRRVLVVDDNVGAARILGLLLTTSGKHEVEYAHDGASALAAAYKFKPEIILLDIGQPGMNGYDVVRELRSDRHFQHTLVVALTGYGTEQDRLRSLEAGFDDHLVKPPSLDMLVELFNHPKLTRIASERG